MIAGIFIPSSYMKLIVKMLTEEAESVEEKSF
jgi:hypothetical protein